jgi:hypothetical protein
MGMDGFCCDESMMIGRVYIYTQQTPLAFVMTVEAFVITVDWRLPAGLGLVSGSNEASLVIH